MLFNRLKFGENKQKVTKNTYLIKNVEEHRNSTDNGTSVEVNALDVVPARRRVIRYLMQPFDDRGWIEGKGHLRVAIELEQAQVQLVARLDDRILQQCLSGEIAVKSAMDHDLPDARGGHWSVS